MEGVVIGFILGVNAGGLAVALANAVIPMPDKKTVLRVLRCFDVDRRLNRKRMRLTKRINKIEELERRKTKADLERREIAALERTLAEYAISKPDEFLKTR